MTGSFTVRELYTVGVLCFVNVVNYLDRYTVAGVQNWLKEDFRIGYDKTGLLQTSFTIAYMVYAPIFGYLGDRYSRRIILISTMLLWSVAVFACTFARSYSSFFVMRMIVGIGEASFTAIGPTLICDVTPVMFRKRTLAIFYIALPIGSGLGYTLGSKAARITGQWKWGIRSTMPAEICGIVLLFFMKDPVRGEREGLELGTRVKEHKTHYSDDIKHLLHNKSYILSTLGFTSVAFAVGGIAWWGPKFLHLAFIQIPGHEGLALDEVAFNCGATSILAGLVGVPLGSAISNWLIKYYPAIDPIICGVALMVSNPHVILALLISNKYETGTYVCLFLTQTYMNGTWALAADILLSCVLPPVRSTAEAFQITCMHMFGDAASPYLVGLMTEIFKKWWEEHPDNLSEYRAMGFSMTLMIVMLFLGGILFLADAWYIEEDKRVVIEYLERIAQSRRNTEINARA